MAAITLITEELVNPDNLVLYTYGQPRVGDYDYAQFHGKFFAIAFLIMTKFLEIVRIRKIKKVLFQMITMFKIHFVLYIIVILYHIFLFVMHQIPVLDVTVCTSTVGFFVFAFILKQEPTF